MQRQLDPLLHELLVATLTVSAFSAVLALLCWWLGGIQPWPGVILGEVAGFGFAIALLTLTSPRRRR